MNMTNIGERESSMISDINISVDRKDFLFLVWVSMRVGGLVKDKFNIRY